MKTNTWRVCGGLILMGAIQLTAAGSVTAEPPGNALSKTAACENNIAQSRDPKAGQDKKECEPNPGADPKGVPDPQGDPGSGDAADTTQGDAGTQKEEAASKEERPPQCSDPLYAEANPGLCF